jgi:putrescine aminotransferase
MSPLPSSLPKRAGPLGKGLPAGLDYVFLTNSGAEATELGLKPARLAGKRHVIAMHCGFHGTTLGALTVTGR